MAEVGKSQIKFTFISYCGIWETFSILAQGRPRVGVWTMHREFPHLCITDAWYWFVSAVTLHYGNQGRHFRMLSIGLFLNP